MLPTDIGNPLSKLPIPTITEKRKKKKGDKLEKKGKKKG